MSKSGNRKKSRRGSPSSVRESVLMTQSNQEALLALKSVLSVPAPVQKEQKSSNDAVLALKAVLSVPVNVETAPTVGPKADAVQALKSLLMSPVNPSEESKQPAPASFEALKSMLLSGKKEAAAEEAVNAGKAGKKKRSSSPKTNEVKVEAKATPTRSDKKKKKAGAAKSPFAGSLFQSSPDPMAMPMPDFDEAQSDFFADSFEDTEAVVSPAQDPLSSLRMMLKIPA